jgi:membrane-bound lytic murein transglycosylase D
MKGARDLLLATALAILGVAVPTPTASVTTPTPSSPPRQPTAPVVVDLSELRVVAPAPPAASPLITWDLPVTRNDRVQFWIGWLSGQNRARTALWLARSGRYGPLTRQKLRQRGMPEDLTYLVLIESGFSPTATSRANAVGLWQFVADTGRRYGLKVTPYVDDRRDPVKSTDAALDYLQELHGRFGSWYLAAAAYNTGENRVDRLLREHAGSSRGDEALFWTISPYLPKETRDYVPLMLAAGHIGKEPARYGFGDLEYHPPFTFDTVRAPGGISLQTIADAVGARPTEIFDLNQQYVRKVTPPGKAVDVRIPPGRSLAFESNFARLTHRRREISLAALPAASSPSP